MISCGSIFRVKIRPQFMSVNSSIGGALNIEDAFCRDRPALSPVRDNLRAHAYLVGEIRKAPGSFYGPIQSFHGFS